LIGRTLAHYRVTAAIGVGGMGEVYRATDTRLGREVAIKVLPAEVAGDEERLARFRREAQLLASLNHPNVAAIYGLEEAEGTPFLVLELVEGEDLARRLERGPLPAAEAVAIAEQVAKGLEDAHEKGIVHRDLKPANVKIAPEGTVKVLDFGLAKAYAADPLSGSATGPSQSPTLTRGGTEAGVILGTASYMSPEQARGRAVDKRSDVWAFGALLFEMLTGRRLFEGETVTDVLAAVVREEIDWNALPPTTPPRVRRLLRRCLERDPKQRLRDIGEARIALTAPDEPAPATPAAPPGFSRRKAALLVAGAGGGAFALGFGLGRRLAPPAARGESAPSLSVTRITSSGNVTEAAVSPDGRFVAYVESEQGEQSLWLRQLATGQTLRLLPSRRAYYWGHAFTRDGNSIVFGLKSPEDIGGAFYSISALGGAPRRLVAEIDSAPAFSPDGGRMAWFRARHPTPDESALIVARSDGTEPKVLATVKLPERFAPVFFSAPDWSPDGRRIACSVDRYQEGSTEGGARVIAVSVADGSVETLADPGWRFAGQVAWLPEARGLLVIAGTGTGLAAKMWLVPLPRGTARVLTSDLLAYRVVSGVVDREFAVSPDDRCVVYGALRDGDTRLFRLDTAGGSPRPLTDYTAFRPAFSPDGQRLAFYCVDRATNRFRIAIVAAEGGPPLQTLEAEPPVDGSRILFRDEGLYLNTMPGDRANIWLQPLDGKPPRRITDFQDSLVWGFAVSPDGKSLAYGRGPLIRDAMLVRGFL
jgi:Tol biopolymer transport system component